MNTEVNLEQIAREAEDKLKWPPAGSPYQVVLAALQQATASLTAKVAALEASCAAMREALRFYANPETYYAIGIFPDPPCGEFIDDFSGVEDHRGVTPRPGMRARQALATDAGKSLLEERDTLKAENERLRTALVQIEGLSFGGKGESAVHIIASQALKGRVALVIVDSGK